MRIAAWIIMYLCIVHTEQQPKAFKWHGYHWSYYGDYMSKEDKRKLHELSRNFVYQMKLLNRQLLPIKFFHVKKISYQVGLVIGESYRIGLVGNCVKDVLANRGTVREKYKRMMDAYLEMMRRYLGHTRVLGPGMWENLPMHFELAMGVVRRLEVDIHNYIDLLQTIPEHELEEADRMRNSANTNLTIPGGKKPSDFGGGKQPPGGRRGRQGNYTQPHTGAAQFVNASLSPTPTNATQKILTEEDIKREYRENYMKRQGLEGTDWSFDRQLGFK